MLFLYVQVLVFSVFLCNLDVYGIIDYDDSIRLVSQTCSDIEMIDLIMHHYLSQWQHASIHE